MGHTQESQKVAEFSDKSAQNSARDEITENISPKQLYFGPHCLPYDPVILPRESKIDICVLRLILFSRLFPSFTSGRC
jgi:hypothetical protein